MKLILGFLISVSLLFSTANAGYLLSAPNAGAESLSLNGSGNGSGVDLFLMPIEGFQVGANLPAPTYGLSLNEDLVLGQTTTVNGAINISPLVGFGASLYLDGSGVINENGPLVLMGGVNAIGPDLDLLGLGNGQGLVPDIAYVKNFQNGESKVTGGLTVFADLGPGTAKKIAGQ